MAQEIVNLNVIKAKVQTFKLEQLKEVLQQLSMSRSGKKEELSNRILDLFKDAAHLNSSGHRVVDQDRLTNAALVVDAVYRRLRDAELKHLAQTHRSVALHRHVDEVEARYRTAAGGANKRARITAPAAAPAAARPPVAGGELGIEEVIGRFLDGSEGLGLLNTQVRCLCAAATRVEPLLQCCGACCGVWQHVECVKQQLTLKPGLPPLRDAVTHTPLVQRAAFFCERCRVSRADPFWELFDPTVMLPVLGRPNGRSMTVGPVPDVPCSGTGMREVLLSRHQVTLLKAKEAEYKLQAFCLQLDDPVPFRFHWPMAANLTWSGSGTLLQQTVPACRRGHVKLGTNQRDEPYDLAAAVRGFPTSHGPCTVSIELRYAEPEPHYIFMVAIMRRRTREQVKALMKQPESLEAAVERVRRHMRGGSSSSGGAAASSSTAAAAAAANGHAGAAGVIDDDDDVVMGNTVVSLKDPYSNQRMVTAARFVDTAGAAPSAFDLDSFLEVAQATRKWMDPHSSKPSCVQSLQVDAYLTHILRVLAGLPEVTEVEITPEAHWRPAGSAAAFMCVLEQARDMRAAAAAAAAAAACAAAAAGAAAGDSDEEDDEELFRREIAQMQDRKPQLLPQKGGAVEVIEILDSDDEQPAQQQQQQQQQPAAAAAAGVGTRPLAAGEQQQQQQPQQRAQGGMVIRIPARTQLQQAAAAAGGVVSPRQQQQGITLGSAARAAAATAAAAVGPPVPVATGGGQQQLAQGIAGSRPHSITQTSGAAGALQQQQQQIQQLAPHHHQQQQQVPGAAMLQQQLPAGMMQQQQPQQQQQRLQVLPAGCGGGLGAPQGPGPMLMVQGSSMAMQGSLPMLSLAMGSMGMPGVQQQLQGQMPMPLQQVQYAPQPGLQFVYQAGSPVLYSYPQGLPPQQHQQQQQPVQYVNVQQQQPLGVPVYQQQQQQNPYQAYVPQQVYQHEQQVPVYQHQQQQPPQQQQQLGGYTAAGGTYQ